jgi:hypothetical protein
MNFSVIGMDISEKNEKIQIKMNPAKKVPIKT